MFQKVSSKILAFIGFMAGAQLLKACKISFIFGSYAAFFSFNNSLQPLSGLFGLGMASLIAIGKIALSMLLLGHMIPLYQIAFHLPGLCAAYYWASSSIIIRLLMPIICMILFMLHPVGGQAWVYAMYWLIPIALYFVRKNNLFLQALGSTFIAHAVGSVIWLYTVPMPASAWYALLPVVIIERMMFAMGMVAMYHMYYYLRNRILVPFFTRIIHLA
jgi:hypothetical protein